MEKARILNGNQWGGNYSLDWLQNNQNIVFAGQLVSEWSLTDIMPSIGLKKPFWDGETWIESITEEELLELKRSLTPQLLTSRQLRLQLINEGFTMNDVITAINQLPDPPRARAFIEWEYATMFDRTHEIVQDLALLMDIDEDQLLRIYTEGYEL